MDGKGRCGHRHDRILFSDKKEILPFAVTWMDLEGAVLSEVGRAGATGTGWFHFMRTGEQVAVDSALAGDTGT